MNDETTQLVDNIREQITLLVKDKHATYDFLLNHKDKFSADEWQELMSILQMPLLVITHPTGESTHD